MYRVTFPTYYFLPSILLTLQRPFLLFVVLEIYAPFSSPSAQAGPQKRLLPLLHLKKYTYVEEGGGESHFTRKKKGGGRLTSSPFSSCEKPQK